ncbi:MAG: 4-alpha-glucanotransferase [Burkholderiales bacterium]
MIDPKTRDHLCVKTGIASDYTDIWGKRHTVNAKTKLALLAAMGFDTAREAGLLRALATLEAQEWSAMLPPVLVVPASQSAPALDIRIPAARSTSVFRWTLTLENGSCRVGALRPADLPLQERVKRGSRWMHRYLYTLPHVETPGYHRLEIVQSAAPRPLRGETMWIVAPGSCYQAVPLEGDGKAWGLAVQLYALRSERNWGMGDFSDLKSLAEICAHAGAASIGLNPLHALFPNNPCHASPYSPSSRRFLNVLYLDVEAIADFHECAAARETVSAPAFQKRLAQLRAVELVDYAGVAQAKFEVLEMLYARFRENHLQTPRGLAFRAFQASKGEALRRQALFDALQAHFQRENGDTWGWSTWPAAYQDAGARKIKSFLVTDIERVEFFEYLQWQAELQLAAVNQRCEELGLGVGLYLDLAVSVDGGGAEAWANHELFALRASVGCPPDDFNLKGQDWGLPPIIPQRLRAAQYRPFIETLRDNMRYAGALRIDHVMALLRLFWIPRGASAVEGAYVSYPLQDLLGILALESQRNRCMVIGEDLGTVPDEIREALLPLGVLSYRLFYFERYPDASFKAPHDYPGQALVALSTHDLATLKGYWQEHDIALREALALFPSEQMRERFKADRVRDRALIVEALKREGLLAETFATPAQQITELPAQLSEALHAYLARSPSQLMVVQLEDVFGQVEQANLPGTTDQHPNWRRKLSVELEKLAAEPRLQTLVKQLCKYR